MGAETECSEVGTASKLPHVPVEKGGLHLSVRKVQLHCVRARAGVLLGRACGTARVRDSSLWLLCQCRWVQVAGGGDLLLSECDQKWGTAIVQLLQARRHLLV